MLGSDEQKKEVMRGLKSASGFLRRDVAAKVQLRYAPEFLFHLDDSITHGAYINELLKNLDKDGKL